MVTLLCPVGRGRGRGGFRGRGRGRGRGQGRRPVTKEELDRELASLNPDESKKNLDDELDAYWNTTAANETEAATETKTEAKSVEKTEA